MSDSNVRGLNPQRGLWCFPVQPKRPFEIPIPRVEENLTYKMVQFFGGTPLGPPIMVQPLLALPLIVHRICSLNFVSCLVVLVRYVG